MWYMHGMYNDGDKHAPDHLAEVDEYQYLGTWFHRDRTWESQFNKAGTTASCKGFCAGAQTPLVQSVSWALCNCMFAGFNLVVTVAVRTVALVARVGVEWRRSCVHLLVHHLSKVVTADNCVGQGSGAMCAPDGLM